MNSILGYSWVTVMASESEKSFQRYDLIADTRVEAEMSVCELDARP